MLILRKRLLHFDVSVKTLAWVLALSIMEVANTYDPRSPTESVLYKIVNENMDEFYTSIEMNPNQSFPDFVRREFQSFLACGIPEYGLTRIKCSNEKCNTSRFIPTSCKKRGFCPSCGGRRMNVAAINLSERVLPWVGIRQWVISVPFPLRFWMAVDSKLTGLINSSIVKQIESFYIKESVNKGIKAPVTGAVTFIQRWGGSLNLNPHFHIIFLDGVFQTYEDEEKEPVFIKLTRLGDGDVEEIIKNICEKVTKKLIKKGFLIHSDEGLDIADLSPDIDFEVHQQCKEASVYSRIALGPRAGKRVRRIGAQEFTNSASAWSHKSECCGSYGGFSIHANTHFKSNERAELEGLLRYVARSSVSLARLSVTDDGLVRYELKSPWSDGTEAVVFSKQEFLEKLAALVPYPHKNLVIYSGCLAPNHKLRPRIVPNKISKTEEVNSPSPEEGVTASRYIPWAELLKKTWGIDLFHCQECGSRTKILAFISDPISLERIIKAMSLHSRSPPRIEKLSYYRDCEA